MMIGVGSVLPGILSRHTPRKSFEMVCNNSPSFSLEQSWAKMFSRRIQQNYGENFNETLISLYSIGTYYSGYRHGFDDFR